ncbi:MAG: hypothetical protein PHX80_05475 [Candidatus Nanoarchaeia archaeon]|nr:hypothetical protein [Candidatus Nanoarchaeia archaeon]
MNVLKNKTFWLVITIIVITIVAIIMVAKYKKKKAIIAMTAASIKTSGGTAIKTPAPSPSSSSVFPLKVGSEGPEVTNLQKYLNYFQKIKYPTLPSINVNGAFGSDTDRVLKKILNISSMSKNLYDDTVWAWILNSK